MVKAQPTVEVRGKAKSGFIGQELRTSKRSLFVKKPVITYEERMAKKAKIEEVKELERSLKEAAAEKKRIHAQIIRERKRKAIEKEMQQGHIMTKKNALKNMSKKAYQTLVWSARKQNI